MLSRRSKVYVLILIAMLIFGGAVWWRDVGSARALPSKAASLPYSATAKGPYSIKGNMIIGADGQQYIFRGVGRDGLEYNCSGEGPLDQQHLAYMGSGVNTATETYWSSNTVRLPLSEGFWLNGAPGYPCTALQYQALVKRVVDTVTALNLNVILDLQWTDAGGQSLQGGGPWAMPDADSVAFWQQIAGIYSSYSNVLFELYNEPHPPTWNCWASGCTMPNDTSYSDECRCTKTVTYASVGMQTLVDTVRNAGATNLVLVGGMNWGFNLSQIDTYKIAGSNIVYDTHPYPYSDKLPSSWDASFGNISAIYPVMSAESGEYDCGTSYLSQLIPYFDAHSIGWIGWSWAVRGDLCGYPQMVSDYQGTPSVSTGQYIYQRLHGYAAAVAPVNKTWYFAEGRVGASFKEYLTIGNPDPLFDCWVTIQYLTEGGKVVTKGVNVAHSSRVTESVNADLNIPYNQPVGVSLSAIVSVAPTAVCNGVIVERPMYFSFYGVNSGSNVMGATRLGQNYYFSDIATGAGYASFVTILNPPYNPPATVSIAYYVGGKAVGSQQSVVVQGGQRGTIIPLSGLPVHTAAIVTSTQPVVVERPVYFRTILAGSAGNVTGAGSVVGVPSPANDWLFAEGYTGRGFQEYLAIANLDTTNNAVANVTINLEFSDGTVKSFNLAIQPFDQVYWDVNSNVTAGVSPGEVSIEVRSQGAAIVVEREMYFQYSHIIPNAFQVTAVGGNDVMGMVGPAANTYYTFAEGYSNGGYNEWLTLQNPTASDETLSVVLVNGYGRSYRPGAYLVKAHSRYTIDITALVLQNLVRQGDDHRGYEVSMAVQAMQPGAFFVAERPMYWNTGMGGVQGGSDVIGYTQP